MPNDGIQVVKADLTTDDTNICVKRKNEVPPKVAPCDTDIPDNSNQTSARDEYSEYMSPNPLQLSKECFIVLDVAELSRVFVVALEIPIWRGRDDKMDRHIF